MDSRHYCYRSFSGRILSFGVPTNFAYAELALLFLTVFMLGVWIWLPIAGAIHLVMWRLTHHDQWMVEIVMEELQQPERLIP